MIRHKKHQEHKEPTKAEEEPQMRDGPPSGQTPRVGASKRAGFVSAGVYPAGPRRSALLLRPGRCRAVGWPGGAGRLIVARSDRRSEPAVDPLFDAMEGA